MGSLTAGLLTTASLLLALALVWKPLGDYMARAYSSERHLASWRMACVLSTATGVGLMSSARRLSLDAYTVEAARGARPALRPWNAP